VQPKKTLEAASALIPELERIFHAQLARRADIERGLEELGIELGKATSHLRVEPADGAEVRRKKQALTRQISEYTEAWNELEALGGVLKDPRRGLVDFYGEVEGELVWLCWRLGEGSITHYHKLSEGFSSRKAIGADARKKLVN
jgi:hypothetical protein